MRMRSQMSFSPVLNYYKMYQELNKRVVTSLGVPIGLVQDYTLKLVYILHSEGPARGALPLNETILEPTKIL